MGAYDLAPPTPRKSDQAEPKRIDFSFCTLVCFADSAAHLFYVFILCGVIVLLLLLEKNQVPKMRERIPPPLLQKNDVRTISVLLRT